MIETPLSRTASGQSDLEAKARSLLRTMVYLSSATEPEIDPPVRGMRFLPSNQ